MQPFHVYLSNLVEATDLSQNRLSDKLGITHPFANMVVKGKRKLPVDAISAWADALALKGNARSEFEVRVLLDHAPTALSAAFERLQNTVAELQAEVKRLKTGQKVFTRRKK